MDTADIEWWQTALSLSLVLLAVALSARGGLGLERSIVWAAVRAAVQLAVVGVLLTFVFDSRFSIWFALLWCVVMVVFAAGVVHRRAPEVPGGLFVPALWAFGTAALAAVAILFGFRIFPWDARALIPLVGMVVGNSMTASVVAARRTVEGFVEGRGQVEAMLALGFVPSGAARPTIRSALRTALIPQIESTKSVGLVFLPGAMTGLILAGVDPVLAVQVQLAVMYLVLGSAATTTTVIAYGLRGRFFTPDQRLVLPEPRSGEG